jgi:hypothetical protein
MKSIHGTSLVSREEDIGDMVKKAVGDARERRKARAEVAKPTRAIARKVVAGGQMIVV